MNHGSFYGFIFIGVNTGNLNKDAYLCLTVPR